MLETRALVESRRFAARTVSPLRALAWLGAGLRDFARCPVPGLVHGVAVAAFGALLLWQARNQFWWLAGAFSGFLLVAPVVATGLYAVSRALEKHGRGGLGDAIDAWKPNARMVVFGLGLALAGTGWVGTSAAFITAFAPAPIQSPADFLRVVVLAPEGFLFEAWLALGALLAAPVFASSVVAMPLLLDRAVSVEAAVYASWRVVLENPVPMAVWAALIMLLTAAGMALGMLGLVVVVPVLAHASWHAYRDLVGLRNGPAAG